MKKTLVIVAVVIVLLLLLAFCNKQIPEPAREVTTAPVSTPVPVAAPAPKLFTLYYKFDSTQLTSDSAKDFAAVQAELKKLTINEVAVVGHADRSGSETYNDGLSNRRADSMEVLLVKAGVAESKIQTSGRGERENAVATKDGVKEPKNRRVELTVK